MASGPRLPMPCPGEGKTAALRENMKDGILQKHVCRAVLPISGMAAGPVPGRLGGRKTGRHSAAFENFLKIFSKRG